MSSIKLHPSLPAPVVHAGVSLQAKSSVLTGVQDAYWSDEEEAKECPLCLEEMDISDLNFKPCQCEYQRDYSDEVGQFKPINKEDQRRLAQQKKQRERERKDLDALGRRHLANVRVVQRIVVYVVGIGPRFAKEELISTLRSNDYFGQYGRISKIILVKRTPPGTQAPVVGLYITYHRREDAARCIAAVDGSASPGGGNEIMRASYGTTKYCMSFLRGVNCPDHNCMNLHEWGDEKDCFTKEDLATLQHTIKDTEITRKNIVLGKKADDSSARLPRSASWAKPSHDRPLSTTPLNNYTNTASVPAAATTVRSARRGEKATRPRPVTPATPEIPEALPPFWKAKDAKGSSAKPSSIASTSRPSTPANSKVAKQKPTSPPAPVPPRSPTSSVTVESDSGSGSQDATSLSPAPSTPAIPPGLPAVPPGLPPPSTRAPPAAPSYQMSSQVQALLNDVKARRESAFSSIGTSPFPDFDRTLQNLAELDGKFGGFSFNLDPNIAEAEMEDGHPTLPEVAGSPFLGSFLDAFPALRTLSHPPGLNFPHSQRPIYDAHSSPVPSQASPTLSYTGSFNPFGENESDTAPAMRRPTLVGEDSRKMSRFGFARNARQNGNLSSTSSPLISSTPLSPSESIGHGQQHLFGQSSAELASPFSQWSSYQHHPHPLHSHNVSAASSPLVPQAQAQVQTQVYQHLPSTSRFQPFDQTLGVSEAALREFIQNSREQHQRMNAARNPALVDPEQQHEQPQQHYRFTQQQQSQFSDPAIMSASFVPPTRSPSPLLSSSEFPALTAQPPQPPSSSSELPAEIRVDTGSTQPDEKAARRIEKKAAAAERAAERAKRRAEKERERAEKKIEKERLERERKEREKLEKEREQERLEREKAAKEQREHEKAREQEEAAARAEAQKKAMAAFAKAQKAEITASTASTRKTNAKLATTSKATSTPAPGSAVTRLLSPPSQGPLLSKLPKKNRPVTKPIRIPKEDELSPDIPSVLTSAGTSEAPQLPLEKFSGSALDTNSISSRGQSIERMTSDPTPVEELLAQIECQYPMMDLIHHPFFDAQKLNPASKMTLEYGPLAHALSALSVGGGSFANNMPSGSVDSAVSSFQQLLETLTQTISDLLRLLPRTTWDDSSSFDGVLRDMLKGDDFLDDGSEDRSHAGAGKDEVAALTLALERRARWMEVQLSKLEELHRDINTAAVRAVLAFNDSGWDPHGFAPRTGGTLQKFDALGMVHTEGGALRPMTADELEKKLIVAKEAAVFAETEVGSIELDSLILYGSRLWGHPISGIEYRI
ncbi:hypothetical protein B0F90DRAFT_1667392 [Multifurca ochricompacta]|uniref:RNA recognition motif domain-containing protein n=1 Tax=Multifurca ochricompacta TaxID=376703 RepID=A0AAD4M610_9AGAM|nr:hypothetical protein B0F90DRAFT_1667392 [Multifurca ochricompacta]